MKKRIAIASAMLLALAAPMRLVAHEDLAPAANFQASENDGPAYPISGLRLQISSNVDDSSVLAELAEFKLTLGQVAEGFVGPAGPVPQTQVRLIVAPYSNYHASAISAITEQLSDHLKSEGFVNVMVFPREEEIDPETGRDLRGVGQLTLNLVVRAELYRKRWLF